MVENLAFGMSRKEGFLDEYRGKYVILGSSRESVAGRFNEIQDGHVVLNPYQGTSYCSGGLTRVLKEGNKKIRLSEIISVEEVSEQEIIAFCDYSNKIEKESREKKEVKTD
ncbi:MAG: hypothetical protein Q7S33_03255 [Nanoarchaeota archaeon]|nr:hypothetical protein [Nanoarchaeota archaeon]